MTDGSTTPPPPDGDLPERPATQRLWKIVFIVLILAIPVTIGLWIASVHTQTTKVPATTCRAVAAALSDGPDPSADPVGYAEAQVLPLRQIKSSNAALQSAIHQLSSAYESFYKSNGGAASSKLVHSAEKSVDKFCPGVTS
jgi:hypothetical protein